MGKGAALSEGVVKKIVLSYTYVSVWIFLSFTVIVYNKYILDRKLYNWPFPISLTMIHMAFCSSLAFFLVRVVKVVELPGALSRHVYLTCILPIGALYSLSLWFSNSAYIYLSVSFIQMLKALMPVAVYTIGILFKKDPYKPSTMMNMVSISIGVAIAAYGEAKYDSWGVFLQLMAVAFEATRLVMIQILLTSKGISLNPITSLYYVAPSCFVFLCIPWIFVELPVLKQNSNFGFDLMIFGSNSLCAFALNLAVFLLVGKTSALTMNVAGVVKDWLLIAFSWSVIKDYRDFQKLEVRILCIRCSGLPSRVWIIWEKLELARWQCLLPDTRIHPFVDLRSDSFQSHICASLAAQQHGGSAASAHARQT